MKVIFIVALIAAAAFTAFVVFANMMKSGQTGGFIGAPLIWGAWIAVALLMAATWWWS
jgi:phosphatidylserine synthase